MQTYRARGFAHCFAEVADCTFAAARAMVDDPALDEVERFCRGRTHNLLGADRLEAVPETTLSFDFDVWLAAQNGSPLMHFSRGRRGVRFVLTREQHTLVEYSPAPLIDSRRRCDRMLKFIS